MLPVLVTGASGFCGHHLVRRLLREREVRLCGVGRHLAAMAEDARVDRRVVDMRDAGAVDDLVKAVRPRWVFHLAGLASGSASDLFAANALGTVNVLAAVQRHAPEARVILTGSAAEYGEIGPDQVPVREEQPCHPRGPYGISKFAATLVALDYARRAEMNVLIARLFNVVGAGVPRTLVVGAVIERILAASRAGASPIVFVGNVDTERDFIAVDDVVDALVDMAKSNRSGEIMNICSGEPRSIRSVLASLLAHAPKPIETRVDPSLIRPDDVKVVYGSNARAREAFGFVPRVSLDASLKAAFRAASSGTVS